MIQTTQMLLVGVILGLSLGSILGASIFAMIFGSHAQGQIDALNGKIKYEKKENEDGEIIWTKIVNK